MARTITVELVGTTTPKLRPRFVRQWGDDLLPEAVTDAWYAASCPADFKPRRHGVSLGDSFKWRLSSFLRGC